MKKVISLLLVCALLCGCTQNANETTTTPTTTTTTATTETTPSTTTTVTTTEASVTTPENTTYNDDDSVPEEWLSVYTSSEAMELFGEIVGADSSDGDISAEILTLVNKNVLFFLTMTGMTFTIDWDAPSGGEGTKTDLYPIKSEYFSKIEAIENLAYDTYTADATERLLFGKENDPRVIFTEKDGIMYVDPNCLSKWTSDPFYLRSYIEITEITDEAVSFIWHYPDIEGLNEPDEYNYYYYEYSYTAVYENGELKLDELIING